MKIQEIIGEDFDTIKDDVRRTRGKHLKDLVRAKSKRRNPIDDDTPGPEGGEEESQYDNDATDAEMDI